MVDRTSGSYPCASGDDGLPWLPRNHGPDIVRCRGPLAIQIQGIVDIWIGGPNEFDGDTMLPVVTEIAGVVELRNAALDQGCQAHIPGVVNLMAPDRFFWAGFTIDALPNCELGEVIVLPRHDHLDRFMQGSQVVVRLTSTRGQMLGSMSISSTRRRTIWSVTITLP